MSYNIIENTTIQFYTSQPFTSIGGTVVNPDNVKFSYSVQGQTEVSYTWVNPTGDPTGTIKQGSAGTGYFYANISTVGLPGTWSWQWYGYPSSGADTTHTQVAAQGTVVVSASDL
jgi:hypothetical protein